MNELKPTIVKQGATLGANCTIVCGTVIGRYAFVGAGAVVTKDIPDYGLVFGNPGKLQGWMCSCGNRIAFGNNEAVGECTSCNKKYSKQGSKVTEV